MENNKHYRKLSFTDKANKILKIDFIKKTNYIGFMLMFDSRVKCLKWVDIYEKS